MLIQRAKNTEPVRKSVYFTWNFFCMAMDLLGLKRTYSERGEKRLSHISLFYGVLSFSRSSSIIVL